MGWRSLNLLYCIYDGALGRYLQVWATADLGASEKQYYVGADKIIVHV
jgi:hypothetical protein